MNQRVHRLMKAAAATAVAATTAVAMAGTAHATTYGGTNTAYSGTNSGTMCDGNCTSPPTVDYYLARVSVYYGKEISQTQTGYCRFSA